MSMRSCRRSFRVMAFGVMLLGVSGWWGVAGAQGPHVTGATYGDSYVYGNSATLTVAALPLHAEVRLDGVLLGSAHDLVARTVAMLPGRHIVQVSAPGYL